ncbi:interleukin 12 receptor, beta 2a, like [Betta splendens]|uniref:Interleukin 12 receptor, beta 2a, like n=1 Tax=Betta splendens TaxID=158456 RepID=A0A6P7NDL2_BETSP|nr:interleukin 12 receptor, beta 2a, like [Betta splendens]
MATLRSRWLLSILLFSLPHCFANSVSPTPPSDPDCFFPCDENTCEVNIQCTWDPRLDPQFPSNYSLHWETANSGEGYVISETRWNGSIRREDFQRNEELHVWVEAKNQNGSARSQKVTFNTEDINKPPPPEIHHQEPLEIEWNSTCQTHLPIKSCEVRYRTEANPVWLPPEDGFIRSYALEGNQSCIVYEIQVRCACEKGKTSNWSKILRVPFLEKVPSGQLDIWTDCGSFPTGFDCVLMLKKLPVSQTCGTVLKYEIKLSYKNATVLPLNVSAEGPSSQLVCDGMLCYLNTSLKDVSSVSASVFNSHGGTVPAYIAMPVQDKERDEQTFDAKMDEENLTVSWDLTPHLSYNLSEIVVQYKQAGRPPGQGFDWIKVNKSKTGYFKGHFNKLTPYIVSLFTVSQSREIYRLSSVIAYASQGTPPQVPSFRVFSIAATHVTLFWESIPLSQQNGVIQYYQIGVDEHNVHNVKSATWYQNYTFDVNHLNPDQDYKVWIRAVTAAGPGENNTTNFKTKQEETSGYIIILCFVLAISVIFVFAVFSLYRGERKACSSLLHVLCKKVPDPRNSRICRNMKPQNNDSSAWICKPAYEPNPEIVELEIVEDQPGASKSAQKKTSILNGHVSTLEDRCSQNSQETQKEDVITEDCDRTAHRYEREEYSKMVDSDEEKEKVGEEDSDDCSDSSDEDFTSGYEKHFMPTVREILEVS